MAKLRSFQELRLYQELRWLCLTWTNDEFRGDARPSGSLNPQPVWLQIHKYKNSMWSMNKIFLVAPAAASDEKLETKLKRMLGCRAAAP